MDAQTIPAGAMLDVRLRGPLYSYSAEHGQTIEGTLIAPVTAEGAVLVPAGSTLRGRLTDVRRVGLGVRRERARVAVDFDRIVLPSGDQLPIVTRLHGVTNARESLDPRGRIVGIRSTATLGYHASGWIVGAATADPLLMAFSFVGSGMILRFSESEIIYPAGTELLVTTTAPAIVGRTFPPASQPVARSAEERDALTKFVAALPFRTASAAGSQSDLTNLLLLGQADAIDRAFHAAGWATTDELNATTAYRTLRAMAEDQGYSAAPMSLLLLDGRPPHQTWQKGLNTFAKRHHLRVFARDERWNDLPVWPISSTQDIGIGFSRQARTFIHLIDTTIDNERNKVVNDLAFTGCVDGVDLIDRPHLPTDARNATHEPLLTDRRMAVVRLNACTAPRPFVDPPAPPATKAGTRRAGANDTRAGADDAPASADDAPGVYGSAEGPDAPEGRARGGPAQRSFKQFMLSMKHQLWRGNIVYVAVSRVVKGTKLLFFRKPGATEATEPTVVIDGVVYAVATDPDQKLPEADDAPPRPDRPAGEPKEPRPRPNKPDKPNKTGSKRP